MRKLSVAFVLVLIATVAGCGGGDGGDDPGGGEGGLTDVRVGVIPITPVAPVYLGVEQGFFEEEGLRVEPELAQGGAAIVPSVQSGDFQFGFSNSVSLMIAQTQGLPVRVVVPGESSPASAEEDNAAIMVTEDSPIQEPQDLEGTRIGVNTLLNIAGLTVEASLARLGVNTDTIELVEVPFPEMLAATEGGEIDAGFFNEPFTTAAQSAGLRTIVNPYFGTGPELPIAPYFTTQQYIDENPEVVAAFQRAMQRANEFANDNPDEVRRILTTYTEIPPEAAGEIGLPLLDTELQPARFQELADIAQQFEYVEEAPDIDELLVGPKELPEG